MPDDPALRHARIAVLVARGRLLIATTPPGRDTTILTTLIDKLERDNVTPPDDGAPR